MATTTNNYGFQKPGEEDFYDIEVSNRNWDQADQVLKQMEQGKVDLSGGDISNTKLSTLDNAAGEFPVPNAGESGRVFFGKVKKFMTDFNSFKNGIITVGKLVNHLQGTESGYALDARAGKTLGDLVAKLNSDLQYTNKMLSGEDLSKVTSVQNFINLVQPNSVSLALNTSIAQRQTLVNLGLLPNANPLFLRVIRNSANYLTLECLDLISTDNWKCEINNGILGSWSKIITNSDLDKQSISSSMFESPINLGCFGNVKNIKISTYLKNKTAGIIKGTEYTIATLPEQYRPYTGRFIYTIGGRQAYEMHWYYLSVETTGVMKLTPMQDVTVNAINIDLTYI